MDQIKIRRVLLAYLKGRDEHILNTATVNYISTLEARVAELEGLLQKLSYDHECCDSENCRFCIAVDAFAAEPEEPNE